MWLVVKCPWFNPWYPPTPVKIISLRVTIVNISADCTGNKDNWHPWINEHFHDFLGNPKVWSVILIKYLSSCSSSYFSSYYRSYHMGCSILRIAQKGFFFVGVVVGFHYVAQVSLKILDSTMLLSSCDYRVCHHVLFKKELTTTTTKKPFSF